MIYLTKDSANTTPFLPFRFFPFAKKHVTAIVLAVAMLNLFVAMWPQTNNHFPYPPMLAIMAWVGLLLLAAFLGLLFVHALWLLRANRVESAKLLAEKALIAQEKEEQQRFYANLIHEVIKGEAQCMLTEAGTDPHTREQLTDFVKTCELGQSFVDQNNNDLHELMQCMSFIFSNRLHSEMEERYFYCEIDPNLRGIALKYQQKYELIFFLRECLNNIRKYAHYKHVGLRISFEKKDNNPPLVVVEIKDDGIGLQAALGLEAPDFEINEGNFAQFYERYLKDRRCTGIQEIFYKAARMKGHLVIRPNDGQGTAICLRFYPM